MWRHGNAGDCVRYPAWRVRWSGLPTASDDLNTIAQYLEPSRESYSALHVVLTLLSLDVEEPVERELAVTA